MKTQHLISFVMNVDTCFCPLYLLSGYKSKSIWLFFFSESESGSESGEDGEDEEDDHSGDSAEDSGESGSEPEAGKGRAATRSRARGRG